MPNDNTSTFLAELRRTLAEAPDGVNVSAITAAIEAIDNPGEARTKIWFLLDRSGSMQSLSGDVIGGFNQFLAEQGSQTGEARMTVVLFDGDNPFEVVVDAETIGDIAQLTHDTYWARGVTPLYDAVGDLIVRADQRITDRAKAGEPTEDQVVLIFTDGYENASSRYDRARVFDLIKNRQDDDWTFVFMGSNQDSYGEGAKVGFVGGNVQNYESSPAGVNSAFAEFSRGASSFRSKPRRQRIADKERFFEDIKAAEEAMDDKD
jgi:Mg-chelatase subunit ChlD